MEGSDLRQTPAETQVREPNGDSFQSLARVQTPQPFAVFAYLLNEDAASGPGEHFDPRNDPLVAIVPLGGYSSWAEAEEKAKAVVMATKYRGVVAATCSQPALLSFNPQREVINVSEDPHGREMAERMEEAKRGKIKTEREEKIRQQEEMLRELAASYQPGTFDWFKSSVCMAVLHTAELSRMREKVAELEKALESRLVKVREGLESETLEEQFLSFLREKKYPPADEPFYSGMEMGYKVVKEAALQQSGVSRPVDSDSE